MNARLAQRVLATLAIVCSAAPFAGAGEATDRLRSVLRLAGWTDERLETLANDLPAAGAGNADAVKLAQRLGQLNELVADAAREPDGGDAFRLTGRVTAVERVPIDAAAARGLGADHCFVCRIDADRVDPSAPRLVTMLATSVPVRWLSAATLPQPTEAIGLMLGGEAPRFIASEVRWRPTAPQAGLVRFGESILGGLGFDVGRLDRVVDGQALLAQENEGFYRLLSSLRAAGANQLARFARGNLARFAEPWRADAEASLLARSIARAADEGRYSVAPLFNDAVNQRGELFVFDGLVRRAVRVEVDPAAAARFAIDHYYELELFTPDSQNLPLVFCVLELPDGFPSGDDVKQPARLAGFFFKRWAYRTRKPSGRGGPRSHDQRQLAPLLIGRAPIPLSPPPPRAARQGLAAGALFVAGLLAICWFVWRFGRGDRAFDQTVRRRIAATPSPSELAGLAERDGD